MSLPALSFIGFATKYWFTYPEISWNGSGFEAPEATW